MQITNFLSLRSLNMRRYLDLNPLTQTELDSVNQIQAALARSNVSTEDESIAEMITQGMIDAEQAHAPIFGSHDDDLTPFSPTFVDEDYSSLIQRTSYLGLGVPNLSYLDFPHEPYPLVSFTQASDDRTVPWSPNIEEKGKADNSPSFSARLEAIHYPQTDVPADYICPISQTVMNKPVIDIYGHIYDEVSIIEWLRRNQTSPINRQPLSLADLKPANLCEYDIEAFVEEEERKALGDKPEDPLPPIRLALGLSALFKRLNHLDNKEESVVSDMKIDSKHHLPKRMR